MPELVKPTYDEMIYRQKLLRHTRTMDFNHETMAFPKDEWQKFIDEVVDNKHYCYRFIYCPGCGDFRGIALYRYDNAKDQYFLHVTVQADARRIGYGGAGLKLLEQEAVKNGIREIHCMVFADYEEGKRFARKHGYSEDYVENGMQYFVKKLF